MGKCCERSAVTKLVEGMSSTSLSATTPVCPASSASQAIRVWRMGPNAAVASSPSRCNMQCWVAVWLTAACCSVVSNRT